MLVPGSAEYYEIFTKDTLWTYLQRIRYGYMPHYSIALSYDACGGWWLDWRIDWVESPEHLNVNYTKDIPRIYRRMDY